MPSTPFASPQVIPRTFSYLDVGRGRPALFIPGLAINSLLWRHVICDVARFPTSRAISGAVSRWIYPDMGTPPRADVSLTGLARRVTALCDHLSLRRFDLVANNTGGAVAQIVAAHLSQRLSTLTLTNCDTEGNTPPMLFKPFAIAARLGLFAKVGPRIAASRGLMLRGLAAGYRHPGRLPAEVVDTYLRPVFGTRNPPALSPVYRFQYRTPTWPPYDGN
jgi:pimeloyl-ACP methyl ester carboxylesterase